MPSLPLGSATRPVLTSAQREQFLKTGMAHVPGLVPKAVVDGIAERVWALLARRHGVQRERPDTWKTASPAHLQELSRSGAFDPLACEGFTAVLDDVFGEQGWTPPPRWGQAFVTFRVRAAPWAVPSVAWHLDLVDTQVLQPWPHWLRIFTLLAPLGPGGGGTVYLAGSHRVVMQLMAEANGSAERRCAALTRTLKDESAWIRDLCSPGAGADRTRRFMEVGETVRGVHLRVAEITGEAGDVFLMHPGVVHAAAPAGRPEPRLMAATTVLAKAAPADP